MIPFRDLKEGIADSNEPIFRNGDLAGWVTSGGYAHHARTLVVLGYIMTEALAPAATYGIDVIGDVCGADATV